MKKKEFKRSIIATSEFQTFFDDLDERTSKKVIYLLQVIEETQIIDKSIVKKLVDTTFYELRIKVANQYRVIMFAIDHLNFNECTEIVLLNGFPKKSTKDYKKAIKKAQNILSDYLIENSTKDEEE